MSNTINTFDQGDVRATDVVLCMATQQGGAEIMENRCPTITASAGMSGNNQPVIVLGAPAVCYWDGGQTAGTLTANNAGGSQRMPDKNHFQCIIEQVDSRGGTAYSIGNGQVHDAMSPSKEVCKTLNCMDDPMKVLIRK